MFVVTGATGNVGRPLVEALSGRPVRAVSRRPPATLPSGVTHHRADLADPQSLRPVVEGAEALFLLVPAGGIDAGAVLDVVQAGGVRRVVVLSSQAVGTRPTHDSLLAAKQAARGSGLEWVVLRSGGLASNAYAWAENVRRTRTVAAPFGDVGLPIVDPDDIGAVAAVALREPGHTGRVYELTGPELSTPRQRAAAIGAAIGEPVRFVEQTPAEARAQLLAVMPSPVADGTLAILGSPTPDEQRISPSVEQILGRPGRSFRDWAGRHRDVFR